MKFPPRFTILFLGLLLTAWTPGAASAAGALAKGNSSAPINIEADRMVSQEKDNSVIFTGNVDARQGDLLIRTDEMTVYYTGDAKNSGQGGASEVKKMICVGSVQVSQGSWLGTGKRMDYFAEGRKVILSGDAKAWQGQNMVAGKTITYFLDEGRSIVEAPTQAANAGPKDKGGKPGRVKAVIQPKAK